VSSEDTGKPHIVVLDDTRRVAEEVLRVFVNRVREALRKRGVFYFAIPGGKTPLEFYKLLGDSEEAKKLKWDGIHLFWVDERLVSKDSQDSNYKLAADTFLNKVELPRENIHRVRTEFGDYETCALVYEKELRDIFGIAAQQVPQFDLALLGMGGDGHIASLFPGSGGLENSQVGKLAGVVYGREFDRITLTPQVLLEAREIVVVVTGEKKAGVISKVFNSNPDKLKFPVHLLWEKSGKVTFIMDKSAAAKL